MTGRKYETGIAYLPHERLDVYRLALEFHALGMRLLPKRGRTSLKDQLERASMSIVLNIAEGAGRPTGSDQRRFFEIAKASATECGAIVDIIRGWELANAEQCASARDLVVRLVQMLSRLSVGRR